MHMCVDIQVFFEKKWTRGCYVSKSMGKLK
jgi:hypothetical protein